MRMTTHKSAYLKKVISISLLIIVILIAITIKSSENETVSQIFTLLFFVMLFATIANRFKIGRRLKIFTVIVFSLKVLTIFVYSTSYDVVIFPDSFNYIYNLNTIIYSNDFSMTNISNIAGTLHVGHYYLMLLPYWILGTSLSIIYTNTLISTVSLLLFYRVFEAEFGRKTALFTFIFCSFSLNMLLFGGAILKEPLVLFLSSLIIYLVKVRKAPLYISVLLSIVLITVRIYAGFAFLLAILFDAAFNTKKRSNKVLKFFSFISVFFVISGVMSLPMASSYLDLSMNYTTNLLNPRTILNAFESILKFYFAPLPWNLISDFNAYSILMFDSVAFMLLSFSLLLFIAKLLQDRTLRSKLTFFIIPIIVHALVLGHTYGGDSTRQRSGIFVFLVLTIAIGLFYKKTKDQESEPGGL